MSNSEKTGSGAESGAEKALREQWFIDPAVQLAMCKRMFVYWAACILLFCIPIAVLRSSFGQGPFFDEVVNVWKTHWPMIFTVLTFLPFVFYDALKFSNRFVGPVYRLRRELSKFKQSGKVQPIRKFRDTDFWKDLFEGVNSLIGRIQELESQIETMKSGSSDANRELVKS